MEEPQIIYEDPRFLGVEKPAGWLVHSVKSKIKNQKSKFDPSRNIQYPISNIPILTDWLLERYPEVATVGDDPELRPGIVHRLDKEVSGVMVVARTQEYFEYLKSLFQAHEIGKFYYALVVGEVKKKHGVINTPIGIQNGTLKRSVFSSKMAKEALTEYRVLKSLGENATLLQIQTHTGRTHQIRVHLKSIGHPIVGDALYGNASSKKLGATLKTQRLFLHAYQLEFLASEAKKIRLDAELPAEFSEAVSKFLR